MGKTHTKQEHPVKAGNMMTQKTNEDFNKKQPTLADVRVKPDKASKILKKDGTEINNPVNEITQSTISVNSYALQEENRIKNVLNTRNICKNSFK